MERSPDDGAAASLARTRAGRALRRSQNWVQLLQFAAVGASGYVVNLSVFSALVELADVHRRIAAVCSFVVAVANNYTLNRVWTFNRARGRVAVQGARFFVVALLALVGNLILLEVFVAVGVAVILAQAIAIVLVTPINFIGNKLWTFRRH